MRNATLTLLRPSSPTGIDPPEASGDDRNERGTRVMAEDEIWRMAAFRLHDAAMWMLRLATATGAADLRLHLMHLHDELLRQEQDIIRRGESGESDEAPVHPVPGGRGPQRR